MGAAHNDDTFFTNYDPADNGSKVIAPQDGICVPQLFLESAREGVDLFGVQLRYRGCIRFGACDRGVDFCFLGTKFLDARRQALINAKVASFGEPIQIAYRAFDLGAFGTQCDETIFNIAGKLGAARYQLFQQTANAFWRQYPVFDRAHNEIIEIRHGDPNTLANARPFLSPVGASIVSVDLSGT